MQVELGKWRDQHIAGPFADLGKEDADGLTVGEEDAGGPAGYCQFQPISRAVATMTLSRLSSMRSASWSA